MENKLVKAIRSSLNNFEQPGIFSEASTTSSLEKTCVEFLRYKGYSVASPKEYRINVKTLNDLIDFFYNRLENRYLGSSTRIYRNNRKKDLNLASLFVKNRSETTGNSKDIALRECALIIETVFDNEKEFKFNTPIHFGMFGQQKLDWVTKKAVDLINRKAYRKKAEESRKEWERIEQEQQANYDVGFSDNDLDSILKRMEEDK